MIRHAWWLAALVLLSGCSGSQRQQGSDGGGPPAASGGASDGGSLEVTVTTSEIQPVEGADVMLLDTFWAATTDAAGVARFSSLPPRNYTVAATKASYRPVQPGGRGVDVLAGETAKVRLQLDAAPVVDADNGFHITVPMPGFLSCAFDVRGAGSSNDCGRGVWLGNTHVGDPSDKSIHHWGVDNELVRGILNEAKWTPAQEVLGRELHVSNLVNELCNPNCVWDNTLNAGSGPSPLRFTYLEGENQTITKQIGGTEPTNYPRRVHTSVRASCPSTCYAALAVQQRYEMWVTGFYGADPDPAFTALPPG